MACCSFTLICVLVIVGVAGVVGVWYPVLRKLLRNIRLVWISSWVVGGKWPISSSHRMSWSSVISRYFAGVNRVRQLKVVGLLLLGSVVTEVTLKRVVVFLALRFDGGWLVCRLWIRPVRPTCWER